MGKFFGVFKKAASDFSRDDCMSSGAAMAYYAIFSLPPLLAVVIAIASYFGISPKDIQKMVQDQAGLSTGGEAIGQQASGGGSGQSEARKASGTFSIVSRIVGGAVLLFSATGLFAQLQYALNRAWDVKPDPKQGGIWSFLVKRVFSLGMVLVVAFLLLVSFVLTTVIDELIAMVHGAPEGSAVVLGILLTNAAAFFVATLLFAAMFKILPDVEMAWKDVIVGAVITGLLFVIGKSLIGLYLQNSDLGSGWGSAAAAMIGVLVWLYYSSLIVLFGAELTQVWASEYGGGIEPAEGAVPADAAAEGT